MRLGRREFIMGSSSVLAFAVASCGDGAAGSGGIGVVSSVTPTPALTATAATAAAVIVQSGDSIGAGATTHYVAIDHLGLPSTVTIRNVSVSGRHLTEAYAARASELFLLYNRTVPCVLLIQIGTNDLGSNVTGDELYARFATPFVQSSKAVGYYVVIDTILPRADAGWTSAMELQRLAYNRLVRANAAGADAINDIASDSVIGDGTGPAMSSYYTDALHLTEAGQRRLAQLDATILVPFITRVQRSG